MNLESVVVLVCCVVIVGFGLKGLQKYIATNHARQRRERRNFSPLEGYASELGEVFEQHNAQFDEVVEDLSALIQLYVEAHRLSVQPTSSYRQEKMLQLYLGRDEIARNIRYNLRDLISRLPQTVDLLHAFEEDLLSSPLVKDLSELSPYERWND